MSCPVVRTIEELYGGYEYSSQQPNDDSTRTTLISPSGISGGGSSSLDISMESAKFYITMRKLQFARAELTVSRGPTDVTTDVTPIQSALTDALNDVTTPTDSSTPTALGDNAVYFERMFKNYYGKTSKQILEEVIGQSRRKLYLVITRTIDIIEVMEGLCSGKLARDFPSGMSLPTIYFDPEALESSDPEALHREINKIIDYANKVCVGGVKTTISPMSNFDKKLREFTVPAPAAKSIAEYRQLLDLDMEVATYAHALEQHHCAAIKKLGEVMNLCQRVVDLGE
jgi:hypothetical protein